VLRRVHRAAQNDASNTLPGAAAAAMLAASGCGAVCRPLKQQSSDGCAVDEALDKENVLLGVCKALLAGQTDTRRTRFSYDRCLHQRRLKCAHAPLETLCCRSLA
jgi:hypothetical protein